MKAFIAQLQRRPTYAITKLYRAPSPDQDVAKLIVRVPNALVDPEGERVDFTKYARRQPVRITNQENGKSVIRFVYGVGASIKGFEGARSISLDYEAFVALGLRKKRWRKPVALQVEPALPWEVWTYYLNHPDYTTRFNTRIAVVGLALAALAVVVALVV